MRNEQNLGTFVHKSLDFFRSLQVLSNMSKIHKFRLFPTTIGTVNNMRKTHKNLDFFRPLQVWLKLL